MKVAKILVVAIVGLAMASTAQAGVQVWFEATPAGGTAVPSVVTQGAAGGNTALKCNKTGLTGNVTCAWDIVVKALIGAGPASTGYDVRLTGSANTLSVAGAPAPAYGSNNYTSNSFPLTTGGGYLIDGSQAAAAAGATGTQTLYSFRLVLTKVATDTNPVSVSAENGPNAWGATDGTSGSVQYGGNASGNGNPHNLYGPGPVPVINITQTPEPATLGLIGLGVVALIRRRK